MDSEKVGEQGRRNELDYSIFEDVFPTPTKGDGKVVQNNAKPGSAQGIGSFKRKVRCKQCGFLVDIQKVNHSGGDDEGNGAGGDVTTDGSSLTAITDADGKTMYSIIAGDAAEHTGTQAFRKGSGCPFCFSKNSSNVKINEVPSIRPINKPGF